MAPISGSEHAARAAHEDGPIDDNTTLCAHCQRCGRRSILGRADALLANAAEPPDSARLRCDMCGGRRVKLFRAQGPVEMLAFINGRI